MVVCEQEPNRMKNKTWVRIDIYNLKKKDNGLMKKDEEFCPKTLMTDSIAVWGPIVLCRIQSPQCNAILL